MAAGTWNITMEQGATFRRVLAYEGVDLTGATVRMQVRAKIKDDTPVLDLSSDTTGITILDQGTNLGEFQLLLTATDTAALTIKNGVYDIEIEDTGGNVVRLLEGTVTIKQEVTR